MTVTVLSETQQKFRGIVYYKCGNYFQNNGVRLHRAVYEAHHGQIPNGLHVHHIDGNRDNNDVDNLLLLSATEHMEGHSRDPGRSEKAHETIKIACKYASEWHGSDGGREWHSSHAKRAWEKRESREYACTQCGEQFATTRYYNEDENRFCTNACKSQFRRLSGVDNVSKICEYCGNEYQSNRYAKAKTCSRECGRNKRWGR